MNPELARYLRDSLTLDAQTTVVLQRFGIPTTVAALEECLQRADLFEELHHCCCFLRDSVMQPWEGREDFWAALEESAVAAIMHERLLHGPTWMRETLTYSMKIGLTRHKAALLEAFYTFRDTDPLLLPRLVGEALWTRAVESDELHQALLQSPLYLSRWAIVECYPAREHLERLARDSHVRLRREADYRLALLELEATRPLTFSDLRITFTSPLYRSGPETHYTVEDLAAFEETLPEFHNHKTSEAR